MPTPEPFPNAVPLRPREAACGSATIIESCCVQEHVNVADSVQVIPAATVPKARLSPCNHAWYPHTPQVPAAAASESSKASKEARRFFTRVIENMHNVRCRPKLQRHPNPRKPPRMRPAGVSPAVLTLPFVACCGLGFRRCLWCSRRRPVCV